MGENKATVLAELKKTLEAFEANKTDHEDLDLNDLKTKKKTIKSSKNWKSRTDSYKSMSREMFWVNLVYHFTRNNPRNTNRWYWRGKRLLEDNGIHNKDVRNDWDASRFSFDRMYGIVKVLKRYSDEDTWDTNESEITTDIAKKVLEIAEKLSVDSEYLEKIEGHLKKLEKLDALFNREHTEKTVEDLTNIMDSLNKLKEMLGDEG